MQRQGSFKGCLRLSWQLLCCWDKSYSLQWICYFSWNPGLCGNRILRITRNLWSTILHGFLSFFTPSLVVSLVGGLFSLVFLDRGSLCNLCWLRAYSLWSPDSAQKSQQFSCLRFCWSHRPLYSPVSPFCGMEMEPRAFHIQNDAPTTEQHCFLSCVAFLTHYSPEGVLRSNPQLALTPPGPSS